MERVKIGTKSTRAEIIEKLKDREYIDSDPIRATDLGRKIVDIFAKYSPTIVSVDMTRALEDDVEAILHGTKTRDFVIQRTIATIKAILASFSPNEMTIGQELGGLATSHGNQRQVIGPCPVCGKNSLVLIRTRGKQRIIVCEGVAQKTCTIKLPVSKAGKIYPANKNCPHCHFPMVNLYVKGKKPWLFCVNWANCPGTKRAPAGTNP
jgi:DNA topoisomerase I